jgi:hypothetical protein
MLLCYLVSCGVVFADMQDASIKAAQVSSREETLPDLPPASLVLTVGPLR